MTDTCAAPASLNPAHTTQFLPESYAGGIRASRTAVFKQQIVQRRDDRINRIKEWWNETNRLPRISATLPPYLSVDFVNLLALKSELLDKEYYDGVIASRFGEFFVLFGGVSLIILILFCNLTAATLISSCVTLAMFQLMHISPSALGVASVSFIQTQVLTIILQRVSKARYDELKEQYEDLYMDVTKRSLLNGEYKAVLLLSDLIPLESLILLILFLLLILLRRYSKKRQVVSTLHMIMRDLDTNYKPIWHRSCSSETSPGSPPSYSSECDEGDSFQESRV